MLTELGFRHAFFTRVGGVSTGPFESLNFSVAVGDELEAVSANLAAASRSLGVEDAKLCFVSQVHGARAAVVHGGQSRDDLLQLEADAVVTGTPGVACAVRTADCVPVLLADLETGFVAAAHAGWRGVVGGVLGAAVEELRALSGEEGRIVAAIGPHISLDAFEVSEDVALQIQSVCHKAVVSRTYGDRPHVDLRVAVRDHLVRAGVPDASVDDVEGCTMLDGSRFFSYRRDGARSGRHLSAIVCRPAC